MAKRKYVNHGSRRHVKQLVSPAGTGTQTLSLDLNHADLFEITTDACASTAMTIDVTGIWDGAQATVFYDALHACDTLVFTFNGTAERNFTDGSTNDAVALSSGADENVIRIIVLDATNGSEIGILNWGTI
jgi:hypothetical protein